MFYKAHRCQRDKWENGKWKINKVAHFTEGCDASSSKWITICLCLFCAIHFDYVSGEGVEL